MTEVLGRLQGVRARGPGRWTARCPAHDDINPSLSLRCLDDGTWLLKCFAGCSAHDVVSALGLELGDLFPKRLLDSGPVPAHQRPYLVRAEVLLLLAHSTTLVALAAADMAAGKTLGAPDLEAVHRASADIHAVLRALGYDGLT